MANAGSLVSARACALTRIAASTEHHIILLALERPVGRGADFTAEIPVN